MRVIRVFLLAWLAILVLSILLIFDPFPAPASKGKRKVASPQAKPRHRIASPQEAP